MIFPHKLLRVSKIIGSCNGLLWIAIIRQAIGFLLWNSWTRWYEEVSVSNSYEFLIKLDLNTIDSPMTMWFWIHNVLTGREFEIFSLKTESWKKGNLPWEIVSFAKAQSGILVNEYACLESSVFSFDAILRYDCNDKQFRTFLPPKFLGKELDIGAFGGVLCVLLNHDGGYFEMWTKEDGQKQNWIKLIDEYSKVDECSSFLKNCSCCTTNWYLSV